MDCGEAVTAQSIMITFEKVMHSHSRTKIEKDREKTVG